MGNRLFFESVASPTLMAEGQLASLIPVEGLPIIALGYVCVPLFHMRVRETNQSPMTLSGGGGPMGRSFFVFPLLGLAV